MNLRACNPINLVYNCMIMLDVILMGLYPVIKTTVFESYLMYGLWITVFAILFFCIVFDFKTGIKNGFGLYVSIVALLLYNVLFAKKISGDIVIAALNFFVMFFPFYYTQHMERTREQIRYIEYLTIVKALIFIVYSFTSYAYSGFYVDGKYINNGQLTLGYSNPNTTAIYLFCTFSILLCLIEVKKDDSKIKKLGIAVILLMLAYLIICTGSRLETGCMIAVVLLRFLGTANLMKKVLTSRFFVIFIVVLPVIFLSGYFGLYHVIPNGYTIMGRGLFARITIYQKALIDFQKHLLFGNMNEWLFTNSHNGILTIAINIGVVGLLLYLLFISGNMLRYAGYIKNNKAANIIPYFMVVAFFIQACAEASSLTGGVSFMSSVAVATYLCEVNQDKTRES